MNPTTKKRRTKKLVQPGFQLRLIGKFVGLAALAMMMQFLVLGYLLSLSVKSLDGSTAQLAEQVPVIIIKTMAFSFLVLLPLFLGFGIMMTHHIAGPIHRFRTYLTSLAKGEATGPCKIRKGDELQPLCDAINLVSDRVRGEAGQPVASQPAKLRRVS